MSIDNREEFIIMLRKGFDKILVELLKVKLYNDKTAYKNIVDFMDIMIKAEEFGYDSLTIFSNRYKPVLEVDKFNDEFFINCIEYFARIQGEIEEFENENNIVSNENIEDLIINLKRFFTMNDVRISNVNEIKNTILLIDDDFDILELLELILSNAGYKVLITAHASKVQKLIQNNEINLIILDYKMPKSDGLELIKEIKELNRNIPVIFYSANNTKEVRESALRMGALDYIVKPINEKMLLSIIDKVFNKSKEREVNTENKVMKSKEYKINYSKQNIEKEIKNNIYLAKKILVIDKEEVITRLIKSRLEMSGMEVYCSNKGEDGIRKSMMKDLNLIIIDYNLPDINGVEVIKTIKANPISCKIKIIILTSNSSEEDRILGYNLGADDFLIKPFSLAELEIKIKKLLEKDSLIFKG